jgi:glycosyltransferase involved in cell wall biosynthesis
VLAAALRNPHLSHLFSLDPYALPDIQALGSDTQVMALPDGITPRPAHQTPATLRTTWGVEAGRKVALFFGSIDGRKGIFQTMEAVAHLSPSLQQECCLVVVGRIYQAEKERVVEGLERVRRETQVQVVVEERFVEEEEIQGIVEAADIVMLPYQRHIGSSGVLVRAAHAGVPVLGSEYGLVGEHLRRRHLGLAVEAASPHAIAEGLVQGLADPQALPFDRAEARHFAEEHTATLFAETLFRHVTEAAMG